MRHTADEAIIAMKTKYHFWHSVSARKMWDILPVAVIDGEETPYVLCESTKAKGATKPVGGAKSDDWLYLGKGTTVSSGIPKSNNCVM